MKEPRWLLEQTIIAVHSVVLEDHGGAPGIRDEDMLASALNRPIDKYTYDTDSTIFQLAAAYCFGLAKNHPFVDGNKRIASMLFVHFLHKNNFIWKVNKEKKINDNALVALALLVASSDPKDKDTMIKLIIKLIQNDYVGAS